MEKKSSLPKPRVYSLVKLIEYRLALKEDKKTVILKELAQIVLPERVGEMS